MADRPWRIEVAPVSRAGWSDEPAAAAHTDPVAIGRRRGADPVLVAVVAAGLLVALIKPWGGTRLGDVAPIAQDVPRPSAPAPATAPALPSVRLPARVFAPAARTCMQDARWRVCVLGAGGTAQQTATNHFAPHAPPLIDPGGAPPPAEPVVVLATMQGATLAIYAPKGSYVPESQVPRPTNEPNGQPVITSGPVAISAWYVDEQRGSLTLALRGGSAVTEDGGVAANVFMPSADRFSSRGTWTAGRYIVWIEGIGSRIWQQFFDFDVVGDVGSTPPPAPQR